MNQKYVIGLTGNIATGKSLVLRMLRRLGAETIDADALVHELMRVGTRVHLEITTEFGRYIMNGNHEIDRARLAKIVFSDPEALKKLEAIIHPAVLEAIAKRIIESQAAVIAVEAIKLIESGLADLCDAIWVVTTSTEEQFQRLVTQRKMTPQQAEMRIKAQSPAEEKILRASVVIDNSKDANYTWTQVRQNFLAISDWEKGKTLLSLARVQPGKAEEIPAPTSDIVTVYRARREDLDAIVRLLQTAGFDNSKITHDKMLERFFSFGYFIAQVEGELYGIVGWRAENLIASIVDFCVKSEDCWDSIGEALLKRLENELQTLSCEVALIFIDAEVDKVAPSFLEKYGYRQQQLDDLIPMWRETATEQARPGMAMLVKQLLEKRITEPI